MNVQPPTRLASEDVIINAPFSYAGSAQRIWRLRRRPPETWAQVVVTLLAVVLVLLAWTMVTVWYVIWGLWLVPYRLLRRGARKRKAEALRHRELMGAVQGSSATIVNGMSGAIPMPSIEPPAASPMERIGDADRERVMAELRGHMLAGRLSSEEFEERLASTHLAKTRADIEAVTCDLPNVARLAVDTGAS